VDVRYHETKQWDTVHGSIFWTANRTDHQIDFTQPVLMVPKPWRQEFEMDAKCISGECSTGYIRKPTIAPNQFLYAEYWKAEIEPLMEFALVTEQKWCQCRMALS
jgi:hypothetical protein